MVNLIQRFLNWCNGITKVKSKSKEVPYYAPFSYSTVPSHAPGFVVEYKNEDRRGFIPRIVPGEFVKKVKGEWKVIKALPGEGVREAILRIKLAEGKLNEDKRKSKRSKTTKENKAVKGTRKKSTTSSPASKNRKEQTKKAVKATKKAPRRSSGIKNSKTKRVGEITRNGRERNDPPPG